MTIPLCSGLDDAVTDGATKIDLYQRHRWRSEGFHGEAKSWHGLGRAIRRGIANMRIQAYLTAAAINLKRLAAALFAPTARRWLDSPNPGLYIAARRPPAVPRVRTCNRIKTTRGPSS